MPAGPDSIEHRRNSRPAVDTGDEHQTDLVHQPGPQKRAVDVPAALEQQAADAEVLAEHFDRPGRSTSGAPATTSEVPFSRSIVRYSAGARSLTTQTR